MCWSTGKKYSLNEALRFLHCFFDIARSKKNKNKNNTKVVAYTKSADVTIIPYHFVVYIHIIRYRLNRGSRIPADALT